MTINEILAYVDEFHSNTISRGLKIRWISEAEAYVQREVMMLKGIELKREYGENSGTKTVIAPIPYDSLYVAYIDAQLFYVYQEYAEYENAMARFNALKEDFAGWYAEQYHPANGGGMELTEDEE